MAHAGGMDGQGGHKPSPSPPPPNIPQFWPVVPPPPIHRDKRFILSKFLETETEMLIPVKDRPAPPKWRVTVDKTTDKTSRRSSTPGAPKPPPPLNVERADAPGQVFRRGVPEAGVGLARGQPQSSSYFLMVRTGRQLVAYPVETIYSFKQPPRARGTMTLEEAEAAMRNERLAAENVVSNVKLAPRSWREAAERLVEERDNAAGGGGGAGTKRGQKGMSTADAIAQLFGEDEDGAAADMEGLDIAVPGRKGKRGAAGRGRGKGRGSRKVKGADGMELDAEEVAEDIYEGLEGEGGDGLRPAKPEPAEDWEHQEDAADDDLSQGEGSSEDMNDDPGLRKELGLQPASDEEAEKEEEAAKKLQELEGVIEGEGEDAGPAETLDTQVPSSLDDEEDEDGDLDLDNLAAVTLGGNETVGSKRRQATPPPPAVDNKRQRFGTPTNAAARTPTPPPAGAAGPSTTRAASPAVRQAATAAAAARPTGAPAATAAAAARPTGAPAAAAAAAARPTGAPAATPAAAPVAAPAAAGTTAPSVDEIRHAVLSNNGRLGFNQLRQMFANRIKEKDALEQFKNNVKAILTLTKEADGTQVCKLKGA